MNLPQRISICRMELMREHPFFGTLSFHADIRESTEGPTAWTDGRRIWLNPRYAEELSRKEVKGVLLHEILHCALKHVARRGDRDPLVFNLAADIVVNEMVLKEGHHLPDGHVRVEEWARFSTEEVYSLLMKNPPDHLKTFLNQNSVELIYNEDPEEIRKLEAYWEIATHNAATQHRLFGTSGDADLEQLFSRLTQPQIDWRSALWEFVVRTPCDYQGWDRRFLHSGLYLEGLDGDQCNLNICCDTSGSIDEEELGQFLGEIKAILGSYPHIKARLWFADHALSKPHDLTSESDIPVPVGGGGTDFVPFFEELGQSGTDANSCAIYLTDGYGTFPDPAPEIHTLWVITAGGAEDGDIPFGRTVRLLEN